MKFSLVLLRNPWAKHAFAAYVNSYLDVKRKQVHAATLDALRRHFLLFARMDAQFENPALASPDEVAEILESDGLRRFNVPYGYLVREGVLPGLSRDITQRHTEFRRQSVVMSRAAGTWYEALMNRYLAHIRNNQTLRQDRGWEGKHGEVKERTVTNALRSALLLLEDATEQGAHSVQGIQQDHINRFLNERVGYRNGVQSFVRFLNERETLFAPIEAKQPGVTIRPELLLSMARTKGLIATWLSVAEEHLKDALICLFALLYAQPVKKTLRIRMSEVHMGQDGLYHLQFAKTAIPLDPRISQVLDRYLAIRTTPAIMDSPAANPYLFPGRRLGSHLTESSAHRYTQKQGVSANQLVATSLFNAYAGGIRHPNELVKAYGVSKMVAIKYYQAFDPRLVDAVSKKANSAD